MPRWPERRAATAGAAGGGLEERYREFSAKSGPTFARYPQMEPLRSFVFRDLLVGRCAEGLQDRVKHWLRPFLKRARTRLPGGHADVLMWLESRRKETIEALIPLYRELVARGVGVELVSFDGPANLPVPSRVFQFRTWPGVPSWARGAWDELCAREDALRSRALERSFHHACATLQGLYDEVRGVLEASAPKVVLCASTQLIGGAALSMASRAQGISSLVLQHGMLGWNYTPLLADSMLVWGRSSTEVMVSLGVPPARVLTVGSPRHDSMRPGGGWARSRLLRALRLPDRPTFVFFSQGTGASSAPVESARWLEDSAAQYADALNVVVRLHANEDGALYRACPHLTVMSQAIELPTALDGCDWIGSVSSTALYEGLLYGKQTWQFWADHWPVEAHNWRQGLALRVASGDHLSEMMRERLSQGGSDGVDEALVERVFANRGRATEAVADVVASCLRPSAGNPRAATVEQVAAERT